jgi:hypothetical protein
MPYRIGGSVGRLLLFVALGATLVWLIVVLGVGWLWMGEEYALIVKDNGDGTVTYEDGPDLATQTYGEFFFEAVKNSLIVVFVFPTIPYLVFMLALGAAWIVMLFRFCPQQHVGDSSI